MREHFVAESKLQEIVLEIAAQKGDANRKGRHGEKKVSRTNLNQTFVLYLSWHTHTHTHIQYWVQPPVFNFMALF